MIKLPETVQLSVAPAYVDDLYLIPKMIPGRKKICVAMSGGVDSSAAACLLRRDGHTLIGATMCLGITDEEGGRTACCGHRAVADARKVCSLLDIPHYVLDFSEQLRTHIIADFIEQYSMGRTPNPCVRCNRYLKFTRLFEFARSCGYDTFATGHYARIGIWQGRSALMRHTDSLKDQSYFLYSIPRSTLDHIIFPLSEYVKSDVRAIACEMRLNVAAKAESQEICFITGNDYRRFLRVNGIKESPGQFVDIHGNVLGTHRGVFNYTIGQRKGLGIATGSRRYVIDLDVKNNKVILGDRDRLLSRYITAREVNLLVDVLPASCSAKVRYRQEAVACEAKMVDGELNVAFATPVEAATPGQSVVLYLDDIVLGGGVIEKVYR